MLKWSEYYKNCQDAYATSKDKPLIYDLGLISLNDNLTLGLDAQYHSSIEEIREKVINNFSENGMTNQINAFSIKTVTQLMPEIAKVCDKYFRDFLQEKVFGSYVYCDNIKIYKTPKGAQRNESSWLWHIDNNPKEQVKIMLYLSDVNSNSGPLQYIQDPLGSAVKATTRRVDYTNWCTSKGMHSTKYCSWHSSRVPMSAIEAMKNFGCKQVSICGKIGTATLFDNNIVHRGALPTGEDRLAMTLQFRPSKEAKRSLVDPKYTGDGWKHTTFNMDPSIEHIKEA